ncbi:YjzD family protein [Indiicoccus explosivorum]|uniref:YjzD family protein n=1 Tax=Indiicoccus explosivorum TaxID=1917864 RepID=UPI000B444883|nr:YjzD family protein [Indiicoccus explosivorum]
MAYLMTFIWSALLISMVNYVVSAIQGTDMNLVLGLIISVGVSLLIFALDAIMPGDLKPEKHH